MARAKLRFEELGVKSVEERQKDSKDSTNEKRGSRIPIVNSVEDAARNRMDALDKANQDIKRLRAELENARTEDKADLLKQIDELRDFKEAVEASEDGYLVSVDTSKIKWSLYNRESGAYKDSAYEELLDSISSEGQRIPAQVMRLDDEDDNYQYKLISGHRRWMVCSELGKPLWAIVIPDSNTAEIYKSRFIENHMREGLAPCEQAFFYQEIIDNNVATKPSEVARLLGIHRGTVTRALNYLKLPKAVRDSFPDPRELSHSNIASLIRHIDNHGEETLLKAVEKLPKGELSTGQILSRLLTAKSTAEYQFSPRFPESTRKIGNYQVRLKDTKKGPVIEMPAEIASEEAERIFGELASLLKSRFE